MQNWTQRQKFVFLGYLLLLNFVVLTAFAYLLLFRPPASPEVTVIPTTLAAISTPTPFPLPTAKSTPRNSRLGETLPLPPTVEQSTQAVIDANLALVDSKLQAQEVAGQIAAPPNIRSQATFVKPRLPFTPTRPPEPTVTPSSTATKIQTPTASPTPLPTATNTPRPTDTPTPQPTPTKKVEPTATRPPTRPVAPQDSARGGTKTPPPTLRIETVAEKTSTPAVVAASSLIAETSSLEVSAAGLAEASSKSDSPMNSVKAVSLSENSMSLSWEPFESNTTYGIYSDMGSGFGVYVHKTTTRQPNFTDRYLQFGSHYAYKITRLTENNEVVLAQTHAFSIGEDIQSNVQDRLIPAPITPTPTALPADTVVLGLVSDNRFIDDFGNLTIAGEVRNDSNLHVGQTEILITFYDAAGTIIDTTQGSTLLDVIPPGEIAPFLISVPRPTNFGMHSLRATARPVTPTLPAQLSTTEVRRFEDDAGFFHIKGVIKNVGHRPAKRVKVAAVIYGRDSRVINVGFASPVPTTLSPGEYATYEVIFTYYPRYVSQLVIPFEE